MRIFNGFRKTPCQGTDNDEPVRTSPVPPLVAVAQDLKAQIDFTEADLEGADFTGADLRPKAIFRKANLKNAKFVGATFGEVDFTDADIEGADFTDVALTPGRCIRLHRAKNWDKIVVQNPETWKELLENHRDELNKVSEDERRILQKFVNFCMAKVLHVR